MEVRWDHVVGPWAGAGVEVTQAHTGSHTQNAIAIADKFIIYIFCAIKCVCGKTVKADPCDRKRGVYDIGWG